MVVFEHNLALVLPLISLAGLYTVYRAENRYQQVLGITRFLVLFLIGLAVAGPQIQMGEQRMEEPVITVLEDNSRSTQFMNYDGLNFDSIGVERQVIASGNNSEIKNSVLRNLEADKSYLIVSDLQTNENLDEVVEEANSKNSTINFLKPEMEDETSVTIEGPTETVPGAENRFTVNVHSTNDREVPVRVYLDDERIYTGEIENNHTFTRQFDSRGYHEIKAATGLQDQNNENNRYFKTVEVRKKPDILVIGDESGLENQLETYYNLEYADQVPGDLDSYDTVFAKQDVNEEELIPYVSQGNGLVYSGSYGQDYEVLPVVKDSSQEDDEEGTRVVLAVDTSASLGDSGRETADNIVGSFVGGLPSNSRVALIDYGGDTRNDYFSATVMRNPDQPAFLNLAYPDNRDRLMARVANLESSGQPAVQSSGLEGSQELLDQENDTEGAIVMVTDGIFNDASEVDFTAEQDKERMQEISSDLDYPLYFITVGEETNAGDLRDFTSNRRVRSADYLLNGGRFDIMSGGGASGVGNVESINNQHFITRDLSIESTVIGATSVTAKPSANLLMATGDGDPVLTTWRYGLGRVVSFSASNENMDGLMRSDPTAVVRSFSWAVGDSDREGEWIDVSSARRGESLPEVEASYPVEGLNRDVGGTYSTTLEPDSTGFHSFEQVPYSYNYNSELEGLGYDSRIEEIADETGGSVYTSDQRSEIVNDLENFSSETVVRRASLTPYLLGLALLVFLGEVGFRKLNGRK